MSEICCIPPHQAAPEHSRRHDRGVATIPLLSSPQAFEENPLSHQQFVDSALWMLVIVYSLTALPEPSDKRYYSTFFSWCTTVSECTTANITEMDTFMLVLCTLVKSVLHTLCMDGR